MLEESQKMSKFNHSHVMKLVGVCIDKGASPLIVMPFMIYGSLLSYLRKHRAELTIASDDNIELVNSNTCVCVCVEDRKELELRGVCPRHLCVRPPRYTCTSIRAAIIDTWPTNYWF